MAYALTHYAPTGEYLFFVAVPFASEKKARSYMEQTATVAFQPSYRYNVGRIDLVPRAERCGAIDKDKVLGSVKKK